jgi:hypothetical protein
MRTSTTSESTKSTAPSPTTHYYFNLDFRLVFAQPTAAMPFASSRGYGSLKLQYDIAELIKHRFAKFANLRKVLLELYPGRDFVRIPKRLLRTN